MGFGFYGRSFTMDSGGCHEPNGVCQASDGGAPGTCTDTAGVLTFYEVASRNESSGVQTFYDARNTVKYSIWNDQWISYDDQQSFHDKILRLSENCLGGMMVWAIDQDTSDYTATHALFGNFELDGGMGDEDLTDLFEQYTGQNCMVSEKCMTDNNSDDPAKDCPSGYSAVTYAHDPLQRWPFERDGDCKEGEYRLICCPSDAEPIGCSWNGEPERSEIGCSGHCGEGFYELNRDTYVDHLGEEACYSGSRKYCCQSTKIIDDCYWTDCEGPLDYHEVPDCKAGFDFMAYRHDKPDDDGLCRETYGNNGSPRISPFRSSLCCPSERAFDNCNWANNPNPDLDDPFPSGPATFCRIPRPCRDDQIKIADATHPEVPSKLGGKEDMCDAYTLPSGYDTRIDLCCDPQDIWGKEDWPVDPEYLWDEEFDDPETDDALWQYESHHTNNDEDGSRDGSHNINGDDSFGFMMLNGPEETLDDTFGDTHTVVRKQADIPEHKRKREIFTTNRTLLESVFEHSEESFYVYCNRKAGSKECNHVWLGGVQDTIIRLPAHVGEGPFARVMSMKPAPDLKLPEHHLKHRSEEELQDNEVYEVKVDYAFSEISADRGHVNIRVDYTNLMEYWDDIVDAPAKRSRIKRGLPEVTEDGPFGLRHFRDRVKRAHDAEQANPLRKRRDTPIKATMPVQFNGFEEDTHSSVHGSSSSMAPVEVRHEGHIAKRWWGAFNDWLKKATTVQDDSVGDLPLGFAQKINLFRKSWGCAGRGYRANLRMDLETEFSMQATYAYYYSGTFVPPSKPDVFFYFGVEPTAYLGLDIRGNVRLNATSHKTKIIDTLSYPGLAIKGIAAVGPTLDVYGQVSGYINIQGQAKAGAKVSFGRAETYWPQDEAALEEYDNILGLDLKDDPDTAPQGEVTPVFEAGVKVEAGLDITVQPEASVGIQVGGGSATAGITIIDAQLTSFVKGILHFFAEMRSTSTPTRWDYTYGVYLYYNIGYGAKAKVLEWADWATGQRIAYSPDRRVEIYSKDGSIQLGSSNSRLATLDADNVTSKGDNFTMFNYDDPGAFRLMDDDSDDSDGSDRPALTDAKTHAVCPAGGAPVLRIPELRFNCGAFPPIQVENKTPNSPVTKITVSGLCDGYRMAGASGNVLTHAPDLGRAGRLAAATRRRAQCPKQTKTRPGFCRQMNEALEEAFDSTNDVVSVTQCDEFPWAASEEGGHWLGASGRSRVCAPSVQNNMGGRCIRMLSAISSNVGKMEPSIANVEDRPDHWVQWSDVSEEEQNLEDSFWETARNVELGGNINVTQRLTKYSDTEEQPTPMGQNYQTWRRTPANRYKAWVFKRNYTFSMADDGDDDEAFWHATDRVYHDSSYTGRYDNNNDIVCALNIFDQFDYYTEPQVGRHFYNGICFRDSTGLVNGWKDQYNTAFCRIFFGASVSSSSAADKIRRDGGKVWNGWEVKHIEYLDDIDMDEDVELNAQELQMLYGDQPTSEGWDEHEAAVVTQRQNAESLFDGIPDKSPSTSGVDVAGDLAGDLAAMMLEREDKMDC